MGNADARNNVPPRNREPEDTIHLPAIGHDVWFYRIALIALSFVAVGGLISSITLAILGKAQPELISNLASAAVGALAGLLAGIKAK